MSPNQVKERLDQFFPAGQVEVYDLTGTQNHYEVHVKSDLFKGKSRIQQHQLVMSAFASELKTGEVHALAIKTMSLGE